MRILHISAQKPDSTGSGVYLASLVAISAQHGNRNAIICGVDKTDEPALSLVSGSVLYPVRFNTPELPFPVCGMSDVMPYEATRYRDLTPEMAEAFLQAFRKVIERAAREFSPDLVICHHLYLLTALVRETLHDRKVLAICHSTDLLQLAQHPLKNAYIRQSIAQLDGIAALHEEQRAQIASYFGYDPAHIAIVGVGYNSQLFRLPTDEETRQRPRLPNSMLYVGKIGLQKGVLSLLHAYEHLLDEGADCALKLVGGYSNEEEYNLIREKASSLSRPPEFLGPLRPSELAPLYRQTDTFVLPSFFEGLPLVIAEALASGCKVVSTDLPGIRSFYREFVPGAPLWFVEPPPLVSMNTPRSTGLPAFEQRLSTALGSALLQPYPLSRCCDTASLTWDQTYARLIRFARSSDGARSWG